MFVGLIHCEPPGVTADDSDFVQSRLIWVVLRVGGNDFDPKRISASDDLPRFFATAFATAPWLSFIWFLRNFRRSANVFMASDDTKRFVIAPDKSNC